METHLDMYNHPIPEKFSLIENSQEIIIEKKWFSARHVVLFIFSIIWNGLLVFFYTEILIDQLPLFIYLFTIMHATAGVWMFYYAICGFTNKTVIQANRQQLAVRHSPLPWSGQKTVDNSDVCQLYVAQQISSNKGATYITYDVDLITKNNKSFPLIKGLDSLTEARFIEKKLETFLHIENYPVYGAFTS